MLVTLDEMKTYLKIPLVDTTYDAFLTRELNTICAAISNYCGRILSSGSYTQTIYSDDVEEIRNMGDVYLFHYPVSAVAEVRAIQRRDGVDDVTTLTTEEFRFYPDTGRVKRLDASCQRHISWYSSLVSAGQRLEFDFTGGFTTVPDDLKGVVYELVAQRYNKEVSGLNVDFGADVQRVGIPGVMNIDFDYTLTKNDRTSPFGVFLGNHLNALDFYRSERAVLGKVTEAIVV